MPVALPHDEEFRVAHYLARAEERGECLCIGTGSYYPTWAKLPRKSERISQLVCRFTYGKRPYKNSLVMHSCDNKACIRPEHLSWGNQSQNLADAVKRGRRTPPPTNHHPALLLGKHHWAKLKPADVASIRDRLASGEKQASIAADFGVKFQQISKIKLGQRWGWQ